jgi:hypothetical protein
LFFFFNFFIKKININDLIWLFYISVERPIFEGIRLDAVRSQRPWLRLLAECTAELFGTAILVVFGCSGIAQYTLSRGVLSSFLSVNFAFGFGAMIAVYVAGPISGKSCLLYFSKENNYIFIDC